MKKLSLILPFTLILCFMVGCQDKEEMAELEAFRAQAKVEEQNKEIVRKLEKELNSNNFDAVNELHDPNFVLHLAGHSESYTLEDTNQLMQGFYTSITKKKHVIELIVAEGDKVAMMVTAHGSHDKEYTGIPPSGVDVEFSQFLIMRITDGKIVEAWELTDLLGLSQQLGMELKPK